MTPLRNKSLTLMACMGLCCGILQVATGATITYDSPQSISNTSDGSFIQTSGTFVLAGNVAGSNTIGSDYTVNGITFDSEVDGTYTDNGVTATLEAPGAGGSQLDVNTTPDTAFTDSGLQEIFSGVAISHFGNSGASEAYLTFELSGLTVGQEYRLQAMSQRNDGTFAVSTVWQNDSIATPSSNQSDFMVPSSTTAGYLSMSWTADAATQAFRLQHADDEVVTNNGRAILNAFVVHAIPEPSTFTLVLGSVFAVGLLGRRRVRG